MMKFAETLRELLKPFLLDGRVGPVHICVYLAILQCGKGRHGWFFIRREGVMKLAKIKGTTTYYRVMRELAEWGFVEYWASRNRKTGSRVRIKPIGIPNNGEDGPGQPVRAQDRSLIAKHNHNL